MPSKPAENPQRKMLVQEPDLTLTPDREVHRHERPLNLPLKSGARSIDVVVAEARRGLFHEILEALESNTSLGWSGPYATLTTAFEKAYANYAGAIVKSVAADVQAEDAEDCLTKLRGNTTEVLLRWIEPSEQRFEDESQPRLIDETLDGEWELRLEEAYQMFRPQHPLGSSTDLDAAEFRLSFEYRLRYQRYRVPFEAKVKSVLHRAIIEVEPLVRAQFLAKKKIPHRKMLEGKEPHASDSTTAGRWEEIEIKFLSDERVQVWHGIDTTTLNYTEMGFDDRRTGKPSSGWLILRAFAEASGVISQPPSSTRAWSRVEKGVQRIRKRLQRHFGINGDPIPFVKDKGYRTLFKISCGPSFRT